MGVLGILANHNGPKTGTKCCLGYIIISWIYVINLIISLQWGHNERDGVPYHQRLGCLLNRLFRLYKKKNINAPCPWPLWRESTGDRWIPLTKASYAENLSIWWCHHISGLFNWSCGNRMITLPTTEVSLTEMGKLDLCQTAIHINEARNVWIGLRRCSMLLSLSGFLVCVL